MRENSAFSKMYDDDRWKTKSRQIRERDNYTCQECNRDQTEVPLHVHHAYYASNKKGTPRRLWDYPDETLITVCEECHDSIHSALTKVKQMVGLLTKSNLDHLHDQLADFLKG